MGKIREFRCHHEKGCSQPGRYWQMKSYAVEYNNHGQVVEQPTIDVAPQLGDVFSCTECGQAAWLRWVDEREVNGRKAEKSEQVMLL